MRALAASLAVACLGVLVLWQATDGLRVLTTEGARRLRVAERGVEIPPVALTDMAGRRIALPDGKVTLVEFIYATCPTICQSAGDDFARLRDRLHDAAANGKVRLLSVSFDPARDDRETLAAYGALHGADGARWTVAVPAAEALEPLLQAFGVTVIDDGVGGYAHNVAIHLLDADGRLIGIFDPGDIETAASAAEGLL